MAVYILAHSVKPNLTEQNKIFENLLRSYNSLEIINHRYFKLSAIFCKFAENTELFQDILERSGCF